MGERIGEDAAEQVRIAASKQFWTTVLLSSWLGGMVASSAIAGFTLRTNRILAVLSLFVLLAFVVFAVVWGS